MYQWTVEMTFIKCLAHSWHSKNSSFSHCLLCFPTRPCFRRTFGRTLQNARTLFILALSPTLQMRKWRLWGNDPKAMGDQAWDHVSFAKNLRVCRDDCAKSIRRTNRCPHVRPLVSFWWPAPGRSKLRGPEAAALDPARVWFRPFGLFYFAF